MPKVKKQRGLYSKEKLVEAVRAVMNGEMTSIEASIEHHIPSSTIRMHVNNPSLNIGSGRPFYLSLKQEGYLVDVLLSLESMGLRLTKGVLQKIAGEYIQLVANDHRLESEYLKSGA